jgi:hypothetical protein
MTDCTQPEQDRWKYGRATNTALRNASLKRPTSADPARDRIDVVVATGDLFTYCYDRHHNQLGAFNGVGLTNGRKIGEWLIEGPKTDE